VANIAIKNIVQIQGSNNLQIKYIGDALADLQHQLNQQQQKLGLSASATPPAPPAIAAVTVVASNGVADLAITDNNSIFRPIEYFAEYSTDPSFPVAKTHIVPMGGARNIRIPVFLGATPVYFRAYSQYSDGPASQAVNFGGATPTGVATGGAGPALGVGQLAGTATATGQGRGDDLVRDDSGVPAVL